MNFDMFALAAIHAGGILGAVIGAWRAVPVWKAVVIVAAFMAAGFLMPVKRSSFTLFEYWVGSIVLFSLAAAGIAAYLLRVPAIVAVRIVFVAVTLMALIAAWLV